MLWNFSTCVHSSYIYSTLLFHHLTSNWHSCLHSIGDTITRTCVSYPNPDSTDATWWWRHCTTCIMSTVNRQHTLQYRYMYNQWVVRSEQLYTYSLWLNDQNHLYHRYYFTINHVKNQLNMLSTINVTDNIIFSAFWYLLNKLHTYKYQCWDYCKSNYN